MSHKLHFIGLFVFYMRRKAVFFNSTVGNTVNKSCPNCSAITNDKFILTFTIKPGNYVERQNKFIAYYT